MANANITKTDDTIKKNPNKRKVNTNKKVVRKLSDKMTRIDN